MDLAIFTVVDQMYQPDRSLGMTQALQIFHLNGTVITNQLANLGMTVNGGLDL